MGMIFCRGCGKEIHESAAACPKCGVVQNIAHAKSSEKGLDFYWQFWRKGLTFSGRTRRRDFWLSQLANIGAVIPLAILDAVFFNATNGVGILTSLFSLAIIIPSLAISVRRLHDIGKSGLWVLLYLVPIAGIIVMIFFCFDSQKGDNIYGADPKGRVLVEAPTEV